MIKESVKQFQGVEIDSFDGLLVEYARKKKATAVGGDCAQYRILSMSFKWR